MSVLRLNPTGLRAADLVPPVSKSDAQRALVLGRILDMPTLARIDEPEAELPADVRIMTTGLQTLAQSGPGPFDIHCEDGGAPFRILVGQAAVASGKTVRMTGTPRLGERPHAALFDSL